MREFFAANAGTLAVGFVVLAVAAAIVLKLVRDRRKGKMLGCDCCSGGCAGCGGYPKE